MSTPLCPNHIQMVEWWSDGVGSCTCRMAAAMYCRAIVQACSATFHLHTQLVNVVLISFIVPYMHCLPIPQCQCSRHLYREYILCFPIYNTVALYHCTNKQWACVPVIIAVVPTLWTTVQPASEDHRQGVVLAVCLLRNDACPFYYLLHYV